MADTDYEQEDEDVGDDLPPHQAFAAELAQLQVDLIRFKPKDSGQGVTNFARDFFLPIVTRLYESLGESADELFDQVDELGQKLDAVAANVGNVLAVAQANALAEQLAHSVIAGAPAEQLKALAEAYATTVTVTRVQLQALVAAMTGLGEEEVEPEGPAEAAPEPAVESEAPNPSPTAAKPAINLPGLPKAPIAAKPA